MLDFLRHDLYVVWASMEARGRETRAGRGSSPGSVCALTVTRGAYVALAVPSLTGR